MTNRGINNDADLPPDYLTVIYNEIKEEPISLKKQPITAEPAATQANMTDKLRKKLYESEMESIASTAKALMEAVSHVTTHFISTTHSEHVRPMFKLVWRPALAAFSFQLMYEDQKEIIGLVLDGVRCAVRLSGIFALELERDSFVSLLSRFSLLQATSGVEEMQAKNIDAIKTLITVAYTGLLTNVEIHVRFHDLLLLQISFEIVRKNARTSIFKKTRTLSNSLNLSLNSCELMYKTFLDGNYLGLAWGEVLRCISQLELLQLIGSGVKEGAPKKKSTTAEKSHSDLQKSLAETSIQSVVVAVDRIFAESSKLNGLKNLVSANVSCTSANRNIEN